ncbi:MAG: hypothetical protein EOO45_20750 [Flavobacterium sp.]|nr:MAG: hypothetical protein EOO45_20750 [Flavobacterium sp.]
MESTITRNENNYNAVRTASYEHVVTEIEKIEKQEELSCNQLLKNLLRTNLRLLKINDISTILLF